MERFKIIFLTGKSISSKIVYNELSKNYTFEKVIVEDGLSSSNILFKRYKRLGIFTTLDQLLFMLLRKVIFRFSKKRIKEIINDNCLDTKEIPTKKIINVSSINDDSVKDILTNCKPDLVIVNGTRIISKDIINCVDCIFINTHVGITPKYRGVHGAYWAIVNNDLENCGVTVHLIDEGIDTGDVLYQAKIKPDFNRDNFTTYPYLQIAKALPLIKKVITDCKSDEINSFKVDLPSKIWSHPTFSFYLINFLKGKK